LNPTTWKGTPSLNAVTGWVNLAERGRVNLSERHRFFMFAGCTAIYFITAAFFLPETKGETLEEIEDHFEGGRRKTRTRN
jgi:hypothetical protein